MYLCHPAVFSTQKMAQFSSQAAEETLFNAVNGKRIIILNRPKALNALNLNMIRQIYPKMVVSETVVAM